MQGTYALPIYAISVQNEPEITTPYESCLWTPAQIQSFIGTYLKPAFVAAGLSTKILAAESFQWLENTIAPTLQNTVASKALDIVAAHPYHAGELIDC
jgi:glucuronoarabinoxylan endo-1,4-beta-xylanase